MHDDTVADVLARHTDRLMRIRGVVGTAEGECAGHPCIVVMVERRSAALDGLIPKELDGVPVEIRETGLIRALY